jgi:hypothetical protein
VVRIRWAGARKLDFVFSICDPETNEVCAYWPGQPMHAHWHIAEPLEQKDVNEYYRLLDETFEHLLRCVNGFLNLPFEVMEKFALQRKNGGPDTRLGPGSLPVTPLRARVRAAS